MQTSAPNYAYPSPEGEYSKEMRRPCVYSFWVNERGGKDILKVWTLFLLPSRVSVSGPLPVVRGRGGRKQALRDVGREARVGREQASLVRPL